MVAVDQAGAAAAQVAESLPGPATWVEADVSSEAGVERYMDVRPSVSSGALTCIISTPASRGRWAAFPTCRRRTSTG